MSNRVFQDVFGFGPEHSWSDVARWIARNETDRLEMLRRLDEVPREEVGGEEKERDRLVAAFRVNMMRYQPGYSHAEFDALIAKMENTND